MEQILDTPDNNFSTIDLKYAGFWIRFGALFIDGIILGVFQVLVSFIAIGSSGFGIVNIGLSIFNGIVGITYFVVMESSSYQGTLGKMAVGIKVVDMEGQRISVGKALGRYFSKIVSYLIIGIGFLMVGWDAKKQGLHDKMAGTLVVAK